MELKDSKTKENLMRAFAGESQARNRYTFAAQLAMENNLYVIKEVFDLTAKQETEHAEVFYRFLKEIEGMEVVINGAGYPVTDAPYRHRRSSRGAQGIHTGRVDGCYAAFLRI